MDIERTRGVIRTMWGERLMVILLRLSEITLILRLMIDLMGLTCLSSKMLNQNS